MHTKNSKSNNLDDKEDSVSSEKSRSSAEVDAEGDKLEQTKSTAPIIASPSQNKGTAYDEEDAGSATNSTSTTVEPIKKEENAPDEPVVSTRSADKASTPTPSADGSIPQHTHEFEASTGASSTSSTTSASGGVKRESTTTDVAPSSEETEPRTLKKHKSIPAMKTSPLLYSEDLSSEASTSDKPSESQSKTSASPPSNVLLNRTVRQRIAIACRYCRRRKIKCYGFDPNVENSKCANCRRFNQECIFTPVSSVSAPLKNISRQMVGWPAQARSDSPRRAVSLQYPPGQYQEQAPVDTQQQQQQDQQSQLQQQQQQQQQPRQQVFYWQSAPAIPPHTIHSQGQVPMYNTVSSVPSVASVPQVMSPNVLNSSMAGVYVPQSSSGQGRIYLPVPPPQVMTTPPGPGPQQMIPGQPPIPGPGPPGPPPPQSVQYTHQQGMPGSQQQMSHQQMSQQQMVPIQMVQGAPVVSGAQPYANMPPQVQYTTHIPAYGQIGQIGQVNQMGQISQVGQLGMPINYGGQYVYQGMPPQPTAHVVQNMEPGMVVGANVPPPEAILEQGTPDNGREGSGDSKKSHVQSTLNH